MLPPAIYYVVVNKSGFAEAKATNIEVRVTETTRITIALKPGTVTEKVVISAEVTTVETTNATTGQIHYLEPCAIFRSRRRTSSNC